MVCSRCKMVVKSVFENLEISTVSVELGIVELKNILSIKKLKK